MMNENNDQSTDRIDHEKRVEEALKEINHLEYVKVSELSDGVADVRVQVAEHMENALINNGEFAQFHRADYVGHHVDFDKQFIDLRYIGPDTN